MLPCGMSFGLQVGEEYCEISLYWIEIAYQISSGAAELLEGLYKEAVISSFNYKATAKIYFVSLKRKFIKMNVQKFLQFSCDVSQ